MPLGSLLVYLQAHWGSTLEEIFSGKRVLLLIAAATVGAGTGAVALDELYERTLRRSLQLLRVPDRKP